MGKLEKISIDTPIGTPVLVVRDDHSILETKTRSEPWKVSGFWLVKCEGISGGYNIDRISKIGN